MQISQCTEIQVSISGGYLESIFELSESFLFENSDHQEAIEVLIDKRDAGPQYESLMDLIFCEVFPEWKIPCRRFYAGKGLQMRYIVTIDQIRRYDLQLYHVLQYAYKLFQQDLNVSWKWYIENMRSMIAKSA